MPKVVGRAAPKVHRPAPGALGSFSAAFNNKAKPATKGPGRRQQEEDESDDEDDSESSDSGPEQGGNGPPSRRAAAPKDARGRGRQAPEADSDDSESGSDDQSGSEPESESESEDQEEVPFGELAKKQEGVRGAKKRAKKEVSDYKIEKRSQKNRPVEVSSKVPVPVYREVIAPSRKKGRDPRFEKLCGHFNDDLFRKSYSFVEDIKKKELEEVREVLKKAKNPVMKERLKEGLKKLEAQQRAKEQEEKKRAQKSALKKIEREGVASGKTPYFMKERVKKNMQLVQKYEELKKTGQLKKFVEKRRKKTSSKDHRFMPYARRDDE